MIILFIAAICGYPTQCRILTWVLQDKSNTCLYFFVVQIVCVKITDNYFIRLHPACSLTPTCRLNKSSKYSKLVENRRSRTKNILPCLLFCMHFYGTSSPIFSPSSLHKAQQYKTKAQNTFHGQVSNSRTLQMVLRLIVAPLFTCISGDPQEEIVQSTHLSGTEMRCQIMCSMLVW